MYILSFDIEEWFLSRNAGRIPVSQWDALTGRLESNTMRILDLCGRNEIKATFFILGWVAEKYPQLVRVIQENGHDIGYHSYVHQRLGQMNAEQLGRDLAKGLDVLQSITGEKVKYFRAPYFSFNGKTAWAVESLLKHGIEASSSVKAFDRYRTGTFLNQPFRFEHEGHTLLEFPLARLDWPLIKPVYSGSGYFRILPVSVLKSFVRSQEYAMFYFHPRDFDSATPFSRKLSVARNILNHIGVKHAVAKFEKLLTDVKFIPISRAHELIQEQELPLIKV